MMQIPPPQHPLVFPSTNSSAFTPVNGSVVSSVGASVAASVAAAVLDEKQEKQEVNQEVKQEVKPEVKPEVKQEVKQEVKPEVKPKVKPEVKPEKMDMTGGGCCTDDTEHDHSHEEEVVNKKFHPISMLLPCKFEKCWKKNCSFAHKKDYTEEQWKFFNTPMENRCLFSWCVDVENCKQVHFNTPKRVQCYWGGKCTKYNRKDSRHSCPFTHPHQKDKQGVHVWKHSATASYESFEENKYIKGWN